MIVVISDTSPIRALHYLGFGTLGVRLQAKALGHIEAIRPLVGKLKGEFGFFVSDQLESHVLRLARE